MRCGCGRSLAYDLTGMELRCLGCQGPAEKCKCPKLSGWDPDSAAAELIELMCAKGTASDIIEAAEETHAPEWYVRQVMRDHDWADEAIADVVADAFGTKPEDEAIRLDDERIVSAPSQAGGHGGPAAQAEVKQKEQENENMATENTQKKNESNEYGPFEFMGIKLYNPQAKAMARVMAKQHEAGELSNEAFWKAAEVIFNLENFAQLGFAVRQLMKPDTWPKVKARILGGPVAVQENQSESQGGSFNL